MGDRSGVSQEQLRAAEKFLHEHIPLTRAMGVRVVPDAASGFAVIAPVALNYNHLQTAFGGSINSVATLAGYAFLWLALAESTPRIVISASSIRFHAPVQTMIRARCEPVDPAEMSAFRDGLRTERRARIELQVRVEEDNVIAARFQGTFVASQRKETV